VEAVAGEEESNGCVDFSLKDSGFQVKRSEMG
jgi:hypothetical protein